MSSQSSTKIHASIDHGRSMCGHGKAEAIKPFSEFFAAPESEQCASCLKKIRGRGYHIATLRRRYAKAEPAAPAESAADLYDEVKKTAVAMLDKTIAQIERNQVDIQRFERLCAHLRECGFEFAHKVTPHPYAIQYNIRLDAAQSKRLSELLTKLAGMGYADNDPAFPNITGMRALEIAGPGAPTFTVHYPRQARPAIGTLAHTLALRQLEETNHAHRLDQ